RLMYELLPGVTLFRRPADATFVLGALLALLAGYLVHRWLTGSVPAAKPWRRAAEIACAIVVVAIALGFAYVVGRTVVAIVPIVTGLVFAAAAIAALVVARRVKNPFGAALLLSAFMVIDLAWNDVPNESTGLPPSVYEDLRLDTRNETIELLKAQLAAAAAPD